MKSIYSEGDDTSIESCSFIDCNTGLFFRNISKGTILNCDFLNNSQGAYFINTQDITIQDCFLAHNIIGFYFINCLNGLLTSSEFISNEDTGIVLSKTDRFLVDHVHFENNSFAVILINNCFGNVFYQNNFYESRQRHVMDNCNNSWDNGIQGNYWDDYAGNDSDEDGIGDEPYLIIMVSMDSYPQIDSIEQDASEIQIKVDAPLNDEMIIGIFTIKGSVEGEKSIQKISVRIDQGEWWIAEGTSVWQTTIDADDYEKGVHTLYVSAIDEDDKSTLHQVFFSVNTGNNDTHQNDTGETPGFLFIGFCIAGLIVVMIFKKKL